MCSVILRPETTVFSSEGNEKIKAAKHPLTGLQTDLYLEERSGPVNLIF